MVNSINNEMKIGIKIWNTTKKYGDKKCTKQGAMRIFRICNRKPVMVF